MVTVIDSTVTGNSGTGIKANNTATVTSSTISDNGEGIFATNVTVTASILADSAINCDIPSEQTWTDGGYNLSTDGSCTFFGSTSEGNVSATGAGGFNLQPMAENGGPTETIALGSDSLAAGFVPSSSELCAVGESVDQRDVNRPQGTGCDVGAYELIQGAATVTIIHCPSPAELQSDLDEASQTGGQLLSITITVPNCTIDLTGSLNVGAGTNITINGNGLTLDGQM